MSMLVLEWNVLAFVPINNEEPFSTNSLKTSGRQ